MKCVTADWVSLWDLNLRSFLVAVETNSSCCGTWNRLVGYTRVVDTKPRETMENRRRQLAHRPSPTRSEQTAAAWVNMKLCRDASAELNTTTPISSSQLITSLPNLKPVMGAVSAAYYSTEGGNMRRCHAFFIITAHLLLPPLSLPLD